MVFRLVATQAALFLCGVLASVALTHGLPMTTILCVVAALFVTSILVSRPPAIRVETTQRTASSVLDRQRLLALLDLAPAPMVLRDGQVIDGKAIFVAVNRAARILFQTEDVIADTSELADAFERRLPDGKLQLGAVSFSLALADIESDDGGDMQRLGVLADMTAEVRAAQSAALRDVLQILNHELMNSLTPITSLAATAQDLLGDDTPASRDGARQAIALVAQRSADLLHFAESYRALAKLPPPQRKEVNAAFWAEQIAGLSRARWGDSFEFETAGAPVSLAIDGEQMTQAILNLLTNAFEVIRPDGAAPRVRFTVTAENDRAMLIVEDNGPGIPEAVRDSIFLPFFTTKPTGSGVGLALVRQIVVNHGGEIGVEKSVALGGARFRIAL
jgi:signal transduction histidine kinase